MSIVKKLIRWFILGFIVFFIGSSLHQNWQLIKEIEFTRFIWLMLFVSLIFNILAHVFSAWVWTWILDLFKTKLTGIEAIETYLITNISKYLPGNVWHFVGRVKAVQEKGDQLSTATVTVIIEPLLMAIAALLITILSASLGLANMGFSPLVFSLQIIVIIGALIGINPIIINPILGKLAKGKGSEEATKLTKYPVVPLGGELVFLLLRGCGFLVILGSLINLQIEFIPQLLTTFSFAWLLGLVVPGAPGGLGIFEATVIATLDNNIFPQSIILIVVALFRISSILAEAIAAYLAFCLSNDK